MVTRRRHPPPAAFALVDALIASVILGVAAAVSMGLISSALRAQSRGEQLAVAAMLADEQLKLVAVRGPDDFASRFPTDGACNAPFADYRYELTFAGGRSLGEPYLVTVEIAPAAGGPGAAPEVRVQTLMASRRPLGDAEEDPDRRPETPVQRNAEAGAEADDQDGGSS